MYTPVWQMERYAQDKQHEAHREAHQNHLASLAIEGMRRPGPIALARAFFSRLLGRSPAYSPVQSTVRAPGQLEDCVGC